MTIKELRKLLKQYPKDALVSLAVGKCDCACEIGNNITLQDFFNSDEGKLQVEIAAFSNACTPTTSIACPNN